MSQRIPSTAIRASALKSAAGVSDSQFKWSGMAGKIPGVPLDPTYGVTSLNGVYSLLSNNPTASIKSTLQDLEFSGGVPTKHVC